MLGDSRQSARAAELGQRSLRRDSPLRLSVSASGLKHRVFLHPHAWAVSVSAMRRAMHRSLTAPPALGAPAAGGGSDIGVGDAGRAPSASPFVQAFSSFRPRASSRVAAAPQRLVPEGGARNAAAEAREAKSFHCGGAHQKGWPC